MSPGRAERLAGLLAMLLVGFVAFSRAGEMTQESAAPAELPQVIRTVTGIEMILIRGGSFLMGSDRGHADERPVHRVWVDAFYMDRYEVTQEQYDQLVLGNPSHFKGPKNPVEQVSWPAAASYCNARSRAEGLEPCYDEKSAECDFQASGYRLPTEAEWEYACRAGTTTEYSFAPDSDALADHAWYDASSEGSTHPVGGKQPNPWGLYDMHGNVAEWCNDFYQPRYYRASPEKNPRGPAQSERCVLRGGAWSSGADDCRSAYRRAHAPGFNQPCFQGDDIGFRCVRAASD
jgi:formylglycine-generating enzyme required for sulfatase activity